MITIRQILTSEGDHGQQALETRPIHKESMAILLLPMMIILIEIIMIIVIVMIMMIIIMIVGVVSS